MLFVFVFLFFGTIVRVAVDYTSSNLQREDNIDLHHIYDNIDNASPYQMGIDRIGNILKTYDTDKKYPLWGFGASGYFENAMGRNSKSETTKHGFNVNREMLDGKEEEINGMDGVKQAYIASIAKIRAGKTFSLSGPTYFSEILSNAKGIAQKSFDHFRNDGGKLEYFIFLIVTNGGLSSDNTLETINEIVDIARKNLPMSIVIVGVGNGPFDSMNLLHGKFLEKIYGLLYILCLLAFCVIFVGFAFCWRVC